MYGGDSGSAAYGGLSNSSCNGGGGGGGVNVCILEVGTYRNIMNVLRFVVEGISGILTTILFPRIVLQF